ncbi:hypothetical protein ACIRPH_31565 [Nocardiopsis sp. NPDC101807]|uniref:hypothetical protein n=1 Tax=Nocardiopsis sp. NPDC101807 TaxID=3364339 RepID=UPI0038257D8D
MTTTHEYSMGRVTIGGAVLFTVAAIGFSSWTVIPSLGLTLGIGYPLLIAITVWWRWSLRSTALRLWPLTAICVFMLVLLAGAGYEAAGLRGLEVAGQVGHAVVAAFFFLPALIVATTDPPRTSKDDAAEVP